MAKDESASIHTAEVFQDDTSDYPITRPYTHSVQPELPPQWPAEPHPLTADPTTERWLRFFDITLCLIPLALIAKAILCIVASVLDKDKTGPYVEDVHNLTIYLIRFNRQLTTIFTVVFILIITTVVRRLALYMAQEGATVAKLEQLQASISLPGTLKAIWSLRTFTSRTSAVLILVWGWFYLGSQATTSEYKYRTSGSYSKMQMAYFSPQKQSLFYSKHSVVDVPDVTLSNLNSMYNTFSVGPSSQNTKTSSFDLNGGALIPFVNADSTSPLSNPYSTVAEEAYLTKIDRKRHDWFDVSRAPSLTFVSFVGTTIYTINDDDSSVGYAHVNGLEGDYNSDATYFNVTCWTTDNYNASTFPHGVDLQALYTINSTDETDPSTLSATDPPRTFEVWARTQYYPKSPSTIAVAHSSCQLRGVPVQMKVHCTAGQCAATRMRFTPGAAQINRTPFDYSNFTSNFFNHLLLSNGVPNENNNDSFGSVSPVANNLWYSFTQLLDLIQLSSPSASNTESADAELPLAKCNTDAFLSFYMTTMINTYYQASLDPTQGTANDFTQFQLGTPSIINGTIHSEDFLTGSVTGALYTPQYSLSIPWVIVDLISCKIILAAALAAMWLRKNTLAPDIFGYVSSLTRDTPHLNLPEGGSGMSGLERVRALEKVKVRIADVSDDNGVGKVELRYAEATKDGNIQMAHLKPDRYYV